MHLLLRDGSPAPAPEPVGADAAGAARLAELYAFPSSPAEVRVRAMMNTTIDGAVVGEDGTSGPLRNPDDSFVFSVLRALADVVLVGAATVRLEDYRSPQGREDLLRPSRRPAGGSRPALAIWSRSGELPPGIEADWPTLLITAPDRAEEAVARSGLPRTQMIAASSEAEAIAALVDRGYRGIQAEGGPASLGRMSAAGLLDELCFSVSHRTVGGPSPRAIAGSAHDQQWQLSSLLVGEHATVTRYRRAAPRVTA